MRLRHPRLDSGEVRYGVDRIVQNVETGRFERSLSALTAAGALVTAAEIYFAYDSASFGNKMMGVPVVLGPITSAAIVANGLLLAPLLMTMVGGMGLLGAILRREK